MESDTFLVFIGNTITAENYWQPRNTKMSFFIFHSYITTILTACNLLPIICSFYFVSEIYLDKLRPVVSNNWSFHLFPKILETFR